MTISFCSKSELHGSLHSIKSPEILEIMLEDNVKVLSVQVEDEIFFGSAYCEFNKQSKQLVLKDMNIVIQPQIEQITVYMPHTEYFIEKYLNHKIHGIYKSTELFFRDLLEVILDDADGILEHIMHDIQSAKRDHTTEKNPYSIMHTCTTALMNLDTLNLVIQKIRHLMTLLTRHIPLFKEHEPELMDQMSNLASEINYATTIAHTISESLRALYAIKEDAKVQKVEIALTLVFVVELLLTTIKYLDIHFPFIEWVVGILSGGTILYILYYFFRKE